MSEPTTETITEPMQPRRLEKKANMVWKHRRAAHGRCGGTRTPAFPQRLGRATPDTRQAELERRQQHHCTLAVPAARRNSTTKSNMKKFLIPIVAAMAFALAACDNQGSGSGGAGSSGGGTGSGTSGSGAGGSGGTGGGTGGGAGGGSAGGAGGQ